MRVDEIMAPVKVRVAPDSSLRSVATALSDARTGLAVIDMPGGGVFTERDLLRAIADGGDLDSTPVQGHATTSPAAVAPDVSLDDACDLMIDRGVRHLLVESDGRVIGVVNMRDVVGVLSGAAKLGAVPPARGS